MPTTAKPIRHSWHRPARCGPRPHPCTDEAARLSGRLARRRFAPVIGSAYLNERVLSQVEAAKLARCSRDTIVRARRAGRFPNARLEKDRWTIPADDLVAAGLYDPADQDHAPTAPIVDVDQPVDASVIELARAEARIAGLESLVARQDDELRFLRLTVETLAKRGAA